MTEVSIEPEAVAAPAPAPPPKSPPAPAVVEVDHTPGGWPVVPLALSGTNTTVGMVAAASLAGGPIAAAVAATGAVVLGVAAASRNRNPNPRREARRAAARAAGRSAATRTAGRTGAGSTGAGRSSRSGAGAGQMPGQSRRSTSPTPTGRTAGPTTGRSAAGGRAGRTGSGSPKDTAGRRGAGSRSGAGLGARAIGRAGQVRALRSVGQGAGGSRAERRAQTTAARRAVADARRTPTPRPGRHGSGAHRGPAGRLAGAAAGRARAVQRAAVAQQRARRDARTAERVAAQRSAVRKAPARRAARKALYRSAARFHGRRLLAALLALPLGLLGLVTSPIGRKFNLPWLIHPGRRLYARLVAVAAQERAERDADIRTELAEQEAAADADGADEVADRVERPAGQVPTSTNTDVSEGEHVSGFRFEEVAAEMEQAANAYDPDNAMEILAMVEGLPAALTSVANVMKILAERSDSEFPLEKEVADGFNDIFGALMSAVAVAEDMGPIFRQTHEQDIARHEDPRNGSEAEKGWNV
ncbi:hypothetical protein AB0N31_19640 [Streptomyces sp. NPDC051051]|uniref:hypothetical protein n=1 Tax=Streptomyces sp. NPDC051051 TaxID=3155666 RepID=UPI0034120306